MIIFKLNIFSHPFGWKRIFLKKGERAISPTAEASGSPCPLLMKIHTYKRRCRFYKNVIVFRILIAISILFSVVTPVTAEIQYPAGTAANNPYNYVSSGTVNNPSGSGTQVTAATLTENPYTTDTSRCGTNVNNGTLNLSYKPTQIDSYYTYTLKKTTTNLKTNEVFNDFFEFGIKLDTPYKLLNVYPSTEGMIGNRLMTELRSDGGHYYDDPVTGNQLFTFDSVYWDTFMANPETYLKNNDGSWKYDGIYFGADDANYNYKDFTRNVLAPLNEFVRSGRAVVNGHDIPVNDAIIDENLISMRVSKEFFDQFFGYNTMFQDPCGPGKTGCGYGSTAVISDNSGTGSTNSTSGKNAMSSYEKRARKPRELAPGMNCLFYYF